MDRGRHLQEAGYGHLGTLTLKKWEGERVRAERMIESLLWSWWSLEILDLPLVLNKILGSVTGGSISGSPGHGFNLHPFQQKIILDNRCGSGGRGTWGPRPPLDPKFWDPKIEHFWALFNFSIIFFASLCLTYHFFNILLFHSSNSKIFQHHFNWHMISHLKVFVFGLRFTHFRLLGVHLSLSCF